MKRITYWPQVFLGFAFNWGALLGSSAVLGQTNWEVALPLYVGSICWTLVYDTIYAHQVGYSFPPSTSYADCLCEQDKADDVHANVKSTALLFAENTKPILSGFSVSFLSLLAYAGYLNSQGLPFYAISVGGAAAHLFWQIRGMKIDDRADCWKRFKSNRDLGYLVWGGLMVDYLSKVLLM